MNHPLWYLLLLAVLLFPSSNRQWLDGFPLSGKPEILILILLIPYFLSAQLRQKQAEFLSRLRICPAWLAGLLAVILTLKIGLLASGTYSGFPACYSSPAEPASHFYGGVSDLECERSYENQLNRFSATRLDASVAYRPSLANLVFFNTLRYDYYDWEPGNILRNRIPISAEWNFQSDLASRADITVNYVGELSLRWGEEVHRFAESYGAFNQKTVTVPAGIASVTIAYWFDDGVRSGDDPASWGPQPHLEVILPPEMIPADWFWSGWAFLADAMMFLIYFSLLPALLSRLRPDAVLLGAGALMCALCVFLPASVRIREAVLLFLLAAAFLRHLAVKRMAPESIAIWIAAISIALVKIWYPSWTAVALRSAGNDHLIFESFAYSILGTGSLEGGEPVFYFQPMYRYIKYFEHLLFGDGDVWYAGFQTAIFLGGIFSLFGRLPCEADRRWQRWTWMVMGVALLMFGGHYVARFIRDGLPGYITWSILLWVVPSLFLSRNPRVFFLGMAALAFAYTVRINQLPGWAWLGLLATLRYWAINRRTVFMAGFAALVIGLLPLAHNVYFGGAWVPATTSGNISANLIMSPDMWAAFLQGDSSAVRIVRDQVLQILLLAPQPYSLWPTLAAMGAMALFFAGVVVDCLRRKQFVSLLLLAAPLWFLSPHAFYAIHTYYPRHLVIVYLSMAVTAAVVWLMGSKNSEKTAGKPV